MNARHPTGTRIGVALGIERVSNPLPLETHVPCPGPRFGVAERLRATLLAMRGDESFVVRDPNLAYIEAKKLGIQITTRKAVGGTRIWRLK